MILIGNTNFEMELGATTSLSFQEGIKCRLTDQQLQFLPLFFGTQSDVVAVTALPGIPHPFLTKKALLCISFNRFQSGI